MAALPDGQAAIMIKKNGTIVRVNTQGEIVKDLYTDSGITGLLGQGSYLFVLHYNGTMVKMHILNVYNTGIRGLRNFGGHHTDLCDIDQNVVLLPSIALGHVYTYNISSQTLKLRVTNLNIPTSVT